MMNWNPDDYLAAWYFAARAHPGQTFKGQRPDEHLPYCVHLGAVAMEVMHALKSRPDLDGRLALQVALLHDVIEDTSTRYQQVEEAFGEQVAQGVLALSKNKQVGDKAAQMADSLARIQQQPDEIWLVKLCDRITNLSPPPHHWDREKIAAYRDEAQRILDALGRADAGAAQRLSARIADYAAFFSPQAEQQ
ncbi:bifunctional (p)ppGpp synthetase/guanosine-3',5'-bis(diphosphate) 3'-pyrophosphohydrolase [Vibrio cholerae]|nr:bifunctional (p)ppGpp synthetase/guanosine-3',5'-bis(diphosphate) 3'-pyrophosphohydrolase [Vibrio cholerae]